MNILYVAYSCDPYSGSEDKLGWNIPLEASKKHNVFVLTKLEHKHNIEVYCKKHDTDNLSFFYADISPLKKKIFRPSFYTGRLNVWHKSALKAAKRICAENDIEIIHQITPVEFRSIGKYYKIENTKFICGPVAGGQKVPDALLPYTKPKQYVEIIRNIVNRVYKFRYKLLKTADKCDRILFANYETKEFLGADDSALVTSETAIKNSELGDSCTDKEKNGAFSFAVVSRLINIKGFGLLFDALKALPADADYTLSIIGSGEDAAQIKALFDSDESIKSKTTFLGRVPFRDMGKYYRLSDALIHPSFREATGSVITEAMSNSLPVIVMNACGGRVLCNDENSYRFCGSTKQEYIDSLSGALLCCINNPDEVRQKGVAARKAAEKCTFEKKVELYDSIYSCL